MNNNTCIECNKYINAIANKNSTLYRCGDANVCSKHCSKIRLHKLESIDPYLMSPLLWSNIQDNIQDNIQCKIKRTNTQPSFYPYTVLNIDNGLETIYEEPYKSTNNSGIFGKINQLIYSIFITIIFIITR